MLKGLAILFVLTPALALAQGGRGGGGGMDMPVGNFGPVNKLDRISDMLKLTKDQKKSMKQTFDDAQKEAAPLNDQLTKARLALGEAVASGKSKEETDKAVQAEAQLETQMMALELKAFAKVVGGLEPDQQQRAPGLFAMMRGMFSSKNWNSD